MIHKGCVLRVFRAHAHGKPGILGYFFGHSINKREDIVWFTSVWRDMEVVEQTFGADWDISSLPEGYE